MRILVIGINIRHIASSAARAGHDVVAVDGFCDLDLQDLAQETALLPRQGAEDLLPGYIQKFQPEAVVLGPGLEEARASGVLVLNNPPQKTATVSDKLWLARWLEKKGFPFIETKSTPDELQYPVLVKPRRGAGGVGCRLVQSASELNWEEGLIAQDLILGRPASVSVIGNGGGAQAIAVNEQLIGVPWAGAKGFRYNGNITPLMPPVSGLAEMAEDIISELGLLGSNGVDFLLTEQGAVVVEVNSRFQGSLDTVEMATGFNVFAAHLASFAGLLPDRPVPRLTAGRAIIFAPRNLKIEEDLRRDWTADVPCPGSRINRDDPVLSILAKGSNRDGVLAQLRERAAKLRMGWEEKRQ
ncbi:ATP-grasp domain protein [uncultured archaeon]|nr:ATP-grasp domain protein [uncultured archaeon]